MVNSLQAKEIDETQEGMHQNGLLDDGLDLCHVKAHLSQFYT